MPATLGLDSERRIDVPVPEVRAAIGEALRQAGFEITLDQPTRIECKRGSMRGLSLLIKKSLPIAAVCEIRADGSGSAVTVHLTDRLLDFGRTLGVSVTIADEVTIRQFREVLAEVQAFVDAALGKLDGAAATFAEPAFWSRAAESGATIGEAFDTSVAYYDDWIRKALPGYDDLFETAVSLIPFGAGDAFDVLDLGAGTGLFSAHVLNRFPDARFTLVDLAGQLLDVARARFAGRPGQFAYSVADYRTIEPPPTFDVVVSSLSIHHLTDDEKRVLFGRVFGLLRDGGVFINVDQIRGETPEVEGLYRSRWLEHVRAQGATEQQIDESLERRLAYDRDAFLGDQLRWLREAGFATADCISKHWFVGVFLAVKSKPG